MGRGDKGKGSEDTGRRETHMAEQTDLAFPADGKEGRLGRAEWGCGSYISHPECSTQPPTLAT